MKLLKDAMPGMVVIVIIFGLALSLQAFAVTENPGPQESDHKPAVIDTSKTPEYTCPHSQYINCMPPVGKERQKMCSKSYLEWVKSNCPGVKVVY
jgi:hypothetical protein